ncbi:MAG: copper chaperone PCu(A)C [candidate division KSB1 bacterium]|nr:copper chaperone PCu(A)C [candidate division KSB1 bacterium]MDZ7276375.1 copper chaperone PCu(A)C [candidate division KSB1 bacterium]MDZ7287673.1 copper chaperone PCu(A)C [candidate division KSB1 bacterium]MDZ7299987.1 copper chaperone PCu(A)C [candidate division KSB1 bacterium]MDZ7307344.1 copper chaperone PCu(A)C [candidate division KSB1 bacterium]
MTMRFAGVLVFLVILGLAGCQRGAQVPELVISEVWSRPVALAQPDSGAAMEQMHHAGSNGVVYLQIENRGAAADRLLRATSEVCAVTELHETIMQGDRMRMQPVTSGLEVPAHGRLQLSPGGHHIMLMNLKRDLAAGDSIAVLLEFEKSGSQTVFSHVRQP